MPAGTTVGVTPTESELHQLVAELGERLRVRDKEYEQALQREAAISDLLQVINGTGGDLAPFFDTLLEKAMTLCGAAFGFLTNYDGKHFHPVAMRGVPPLLARYFEHGMDQPRPGEAHYRILQNEDVIHNLDQKAEEAYRLGLPLRRAVVDLGGARTALVVALRKNGAVLGALTIYRKEVRAFSDKEIALLKSFAAQAVVAMENARLMAETREALNKQTASAEILKVISGSATDVQPVFDAIVTRAVQLCDAEFSGVLRLEDGLLHLVATNNLSEGETAAWETLFPRPATDRYVVGRALLQGRPVQVEDVLADPNYDPRTRDVLQSRIGYRTFLGVPILREGKPIGVIGCARREIRAFTAEQIELVSTFADQAVIAIENVRLFDELRASLAQQTATADVLGVINASPGKLIPVFDAMLERAMDLCGASFGLLTAFDGFRFQSAAARGVPAAYAEFLAGNPQQVQPGSIGARIVAGERIVHVLDVAEDKALLSGDPLRRALAELGGARTSLVVALTKDNKVLGALQLYRQHVQRFSEKQIALLENFAGQAVIAMENARLITETREALERQTATIEVLATINSSPGDLSPVFETILAKSMLLCDAAFGTFSTFDGQRLHTAATRGVPEAFARFRRSNPPAYGPETGPGRLMAGEDLVHEIDAADSEAYRQGDPSRRAIVDLGGARTILNVALRKENVLLGAMSIYRQAVRPFSDNQIQLLQGFAAQAVIAMDNARLLAELRQRTDALTESLEYQTAIGEVLTVISRSAFDLAPVLQTLTRTALRLCEAEMAFIVRREGEGFRIVTAAGATPESATNAHDYQRFQETLTIAPDRGSVTGRVALEGRAVQIPDIAADPEYKLAGASALGKIRTQVGVPLIREGVLIGVMVLSRQRVEPFSERQVDLLQTFADQAVIAMENARLLGELREALDQQTATGDVLRTISRSSTDLKSVLETLVETVARLCRGDQAYLFRRDGNLHHLLASAGAPDEVRDYLRAHPFEPSRGNTSGRAVLERRTIHIPDVLTDPEYSYDGISVLGFRTALGIPLLREDAVVGVFVVSRMQVAPFSDKEIELASGFADQALIAIENARLFEELRDRQAELRVTLDNTGDGVVMFDANFRLASWNRNFQEMLDIPDAFVTSRPGYDDYLRLLVGRGELGEGDPEDIVAGYRARATRQWSVERTRPDGRIIEVRNNPVPDGGAVLIYSDITERKRAEAQIAAARDAAEEALEQQTATAEILRAISQSPTDIQPVLDAVVKAAVRFCGATDALIILREGEDAVFVAHEGPIVVVLGASLPLNRQSAGGRALLDGRTCHFPDIASLDPVEFAAAHQFSRAHGFRAILAAPLLRQSTTIGAVVLRKAEVGPFTPRQIELLETFAAQAVIAIENVRLFTELREALEQQTATADILSVISRSPTDVQPVLEAVTRAALRFCGAPDAIVLLRDGDESVVVAHEGTLTATLGLRRPLAGNFSGQAMLEGCTRQIADVDALDAPAHAGILALARQHKWRASAAAPMMHGGKAVGCVVLRKPEPGLLSSRQIALLETFAAQAVIAIENVRLFTELRDSLERLKAAQANLIQSEKMASLGQLTAGIAHEIKNPLNFVNNFAALSVELLDELKETADAAFATLGADAQAEVDETMALLTANLAKIAEHGKRADGIVRSMLSHSRGGSGDWTPSDINALVEEALNLAYHGARAQDNEFNVTLERDLERNARPIDVVPQDVTRVFLNLFGNGFYAVGKRRGADSQASFRPTLKVSTRDLGEAVEIRVRDNGTGIASDVREKLFQPFFTTKPTGEGTGLGLSISYDIVTQQHGGTIEVESEPGSFTEFTVRLPRRRVQASERAR